MKLRKGFWQEIAASKINISVSTGRRIENGRHQPKKDKRHWRRSNWAYVNLLSVTMS